MGMLAALLIAVATNSIYFRWWTFALVLTISSWLLTPFLFNPYQSAFNKFTKELQGSKRSNEVDFTYTYEEHQGTPLLEARTLTKHLEDHHIEHKYWKYLRETRLTVRNMNT